MLEAFIPIDPKRVFLQVSTLVKSGRSGCYQYESWLLSTSFASLSDTLLNTDPFFKKMLSAGLPSERRSTLLLKPAGQRRSTLRPTGRNFSIMTRVVYILETFAGQVD